MTIKSGLAPIHPGEFLKEALKDLQTSQYWLNLQAAYDLKTAEREIRGRLRALRPLASA